MRLADLGRLLERAEQWLLPGECLLCHGAVGADDPLICPPCQFRWHRLPEPQCLRCGQPATGMTPECRICATWPEGFSRARSAVWLEAGAHPAVHALKYGGWWRVAEPMARVMARLEVVRPGATLVAVPLARRRARLRGYNQAERLARALGERAGLAHCPELLSRARETPTQTTLTPEARRANVADAFTAGPVPGGARLLLVDDVFTTGATLAEAARALLEAGAGTVEAVTFARAKPPVF